ncbi:hypothetical protein KCP78_15125 [Salmonella enterica subsp. enterica]|nr:hypothetical protein KCP78_15125 [Salmonella enterica subsp. enterica]
MSYVCYVSHIWEMVDAGNFGGSARSGCPSPLPHCHEHLRGSFSSINPEQGVTKCRSVLLDVDGLTPTATNVVSFTLQRYQSTVQQVQAGIRMKD